MTRGRHRKSDAEKMLDGDPGKRGLGGEVKAGGSPIKPTKMSADAEWLWELVVQRWMGEIDTAALILLCEVWELSRTAAKEVRYQPTDKDARVAYTAYLAAFDKLAGKFGLTPADRAKIRTPIDASQDEKDGEYFGVVG